MQKERIKLAPPDEHYESKRLTMFSLNVIELSRFDLYLASTNPAPRDPVDYSKAPICYIDDKGRKRPNNLVRKMKATKLIPPYEVFFLRVDFTKKGDEVCKKLNGGEELKEANEAMNILHTSVKISEIIEMYNFLLKFIQQKENSDRRPILCALTRRLLKIVYFLIRYYEYRIYRWVRSIYAVKYLEKQEVIKTNDLAKTPKDFIFGHSDFASLDRGTHVYFDEMRWRPTSPEKEAKDCISFLLREERIEKRYASLWVKLLEILSIPVITKRLKLYTKIVSKLEKKN